MILGRNAIRPGLQPLVRASARLVFCAVLSIVAGCALHGTGAAGDHVDRTILTQDQIAAQHFNTVYDAIESLRSNWLHTRGTDSFQNPSQVRVYLDNTLLGDTSRLREVAAKDVTFIRYFDGVAATARWGVGHAAGVIFLSTHPMTSDPETDAAQSGSDAPRDD